MTSLDVMHALGWLCLVLAAIVQHVVKQKDTPFNKRRLWMRLRVVPLVFTVLAFGTQFTVGRIEMRTKQEEVNEQRSTIARIAANIETLVAQGKLSREDARRLLVKM